MLTRFFLPLCLLSAFVFAQESPWSFLNTTRIGASDFIAQNPQADGSGTLIVVLDGGVDCGAAGLTSLPDGSPKIIGVADFSGEGDIFTGQASRGFENGEAYLESSDGLRLYGLPVKLDVAEDSLFYIAAFNERRFRNTAVKDINLNGREDDRFGVVLFRNRNDNWRVLIDLDGDGQLSDETQMEDYSVTKKSFSFRGSGARSKSYPLNFALKIYPEQKKLSLHFDVLGHGTHVAGIAAGYAINGQQGLNGIAPGAQVLSLKIGDNSLAAGNTISGSMNDALEYAMQYTRDYPGPVVLNMSYGIGSARSGLSEMEYVINDLLANNPKVLLCMSAANEGPGISTVGLPAAAERALTVGALNTVDNARDVYGASALDKDVIFPFSSRGGEVFKPDVLAPGAASSAVPPYSYKENKWGTSMASPQVAGAAALLLSGLEKGENPPAWLVKKALRFSAQPLAGATYLDQGRGVINVPAAYKLLKHYMREDKGLLDGYYLRTLSPQFADENGPALFWRHGGYFPPKDDPQSVYLNARFSNKASADGKSGYYQAFRLRSSAPWLRTIQKNIYIKGSAAASFEVYGDAEKLREPGLYSAVITGYQKGGLFSSDSPENAAFDFSCAVIVPHRFNTENGYQNRIKDIELKPGEIKRLFVDVLPTQTALSARLGCDDENVLISAYLFSPLGEEIALTNLNAEYRETIIQRVPPEKLQAGTWEIVLYASFKNSRSASLDVDISAAALYSEPQVISNLYYPAGQSASAAVSITNQFSEPYKALLGGAIEGIVKRYEINSDESLYQHTFTVGEDIKEVRIEFTLQDSDFERITDFSLNVKDFEGNILQKNNLTYNTTAFTFSPPYSGSFIVELIPAFVSPDNIQWSAELLEKQIYFDQPRVGSQVVQFFPNAAKDVYFFFEGDVPRAPDGFQLFGELQLNSVDNKGLRSVVPIKLP